MFAATQKCRCSAEARLPRYLSLAAGDFPSVQHTHTFVTGDLEKSKLRYIPDTWQLCSRKVMGILEDAVQGTGGATTREW